MTHLVLATVFFALTHAVPALGPVRRGLVARLGEAAYMGLYSGISLAALAWVGIAYAGAPHVELWPTVPWSYWFPILVMPLACILGVAGLASPNPFSLGAGSKGYDPQRPGIVAVTRHPVLWGLALWAAAHVPPNGDAATILLFAVLAGLSLSGAPSLDAKRSRRLGEARWNELAAATSNVPFVALLAGGIRFRLADVGGWRLTGGLGLYLALLLSHEFVIGVTPLPP